MFSPSIARVWIKSSRIQSKLLHTCTSNFAASKFGMPAMSPTMEIGGIVDWKVKEGQEFKAGDVLLEVETDKAEIDVEAQDDGIMAKILAPNGTKDIPVGKTIAYLAEPGDDISTLALPKEEEPSPKVTKKSAPEKELPKTEVQSPKEKMKDMKSASSSSLFVNANPSQVFLPSVDVLLHRNGISREDALAKIQASGPSGRISKGDVLLYLGKISQSAATSTLEYFKKHEHLDLENIEAIPYKPESPAPKSEGSPKSSTGVTTAPPSPPPQPKIVKQTFDLSEIVNLRAENKVQPFSIYEFVDEAVHKATSYSLQRHAEKSDYYDPIFEDLISIPPQIERFKVHFKINYNHNKNHKSNLSGYSKPSIFDFLTDTHSTTLGSIPVISEVPTVEIELTLNSEVADAEGKANLFMKKISEFFVV